MSRRHQLDNATALKKEERLAEHRRDRRATRQMIVVADDDGLVLPGEAHGHLHAHRPTARESTTPRHWKLPFWKRRRAARTERTLAERRLAEES